ncbi:MAG: hypothetical protein WCP58_12680 [bacterium]|jgi:ribosome-binding factor A
MENNERIPQEIQVVIAAALARYLKDDKLAFKVVSIKLVQTSQINLWGLAGRQENMGSNRR